MFYLYCLSDEVTGEMLEDVTGIGGCGARLIEAGGLRAVVSDFAEARISVTREHVVAHERVVSRVLTHTTPLPFRFGTIAGPERLEGYIASQQSSLRERLERVRGAVEMSVKIIWDVEAAGEAPKSEAVTGAGAGTRFLLEKRRAITGDERFQAHAARLREWLDEVVNGVVKEVFVQGEASRRLFLAASYLVLRAQLEEYRARLEKARHERPELHFLLSGPWAPYSFTTLFS